MADDKTQDKLVDLMVRLCNGEEIPMADIQQELFGYPMSDKNVMKDMLYTKDGLRHSPSGVLIPFDSLYVSHSHK